ncbi:uncharacterized protein LOC143301310 isoform X2 [Babylonia areolata]|uniref:uncharacterized protein LOC143301310 isoform X2 n=1 Tax=Babylonia areolata TaxID=304850 RepID=UPI003FD3AA8C
MIVAVNAVKVKVSIGPLYSTLCLRRTSMAACVAQGVANLVTAFLVLLVLVVLGTVSNTATANQNDPCGKGASKCFKEIADKNITKLSTSKIVHQFCSVVSKGVDCLRDLDEDCQNEERLRTHLKRMEIDKSVCRSMTDHGACYEAIDCFMPKIKGEEDGLTCSFTVRLLACLEVKAKSSSCSIDESTITLAQVRLFAAKILCFDDKGCAVAKECIKLPRIPDFPVTHSGEDLVKMRPIKERLVTPDYYCPLLETTAGCIVKLGTNCGFAQSYKDSVNATLKNLQQRCAKGSNGGAREVPESVCLALTVLTVTKWGFPLS